MNIFVNLPTGSNSYKTNLPDSVQDYICVFIDDASILENLYPSKYTEGKTIYYEIKEFAKGLLNGDLLCHQVLWWPKDKFKQWSGGIERFSSLKYDLINKETLLHWIYLATIMYNKSIRIAKLKTEPKSAIDFTSAYGGYLNSSAQDSWVAPFSRCLEKKSMKIGEYQTDELRYEDSFILPLLENNYAIWQTYSRDSNKFELDGIKPIFDSKGDLQISTIRLEPNTPAIYKGILHYDRNAHRNHKRILEITNSSTIINGYSITSMYHAFRIFSVVNQYAREKKITEVCPNKEFILSIRTGRTNADELKIKLEDTLNEIHYNINTHFKNDKPIDNKGLEDILKTTISSTKEHILATKMN